MVKDNYHHKIEVTFHQRGQEGGEVKTTTIPAQIYPLIWY